MPRVLTFSTHFPKAHPKAGCRTFFPEKILSGLANLLPSGSLKIPDKFFRWVFFDYYPKGHTIRRGKRWKEGDTFSPRVWSGAPYRSKQVAFCNTPVTVLRVYDFLYDGSNIYINNLALDPDGHLPGLLAHNDGLAMWEFYGWLNMGKPTKEKPFDGQIICWLPGIVYPCASSPYLSTTTSSNP